MRKYLIPILLLLLILVIWIFPRNPNLSNVAGTYTGDLVYRGGTTIFGKFVVAPRIQMKVDQVGETITAMGTLTFDDRVTDLPAITGEINATGFFTPTAGGAVGEYKDPNCGQFVTTSASMVFSLETLRIQETYVTQWCGDISASGLLAREN